jgi:hypothetical protein
MNPIHESGFASLVVLFFATGPSALVALLAFILAWKRPKRAMAAANVSIVLASLLCLLAGVITAKLHSRVDYWIDTGGYGPPAKIRAEYGAEWHASARLTAWVGLVFSALPFILSAIGSMVAKRKDPELRTPMGILLFAGVAVFACLVMAIL